MRTLQKHVHALAVRQGWWDTDRNNGELIALIHSELSECLEALRWHNVPSLAIPEYSHAEEELADTVIRIMDMCEARGWDLWGAMVAKDKHNAGRIRRHGKEF